MTTGETYDVMVVGGGPVGCRIAAGTARAGFKTILLEKKISLDTPICCTGLVSSECFQRFQFPASVIQNKLFSARIYSPRKREIEVRRAAVQAYAMERPALDKALWQTALEAGAECRLDQKVVNARVRGDKFTAEIDNGESTAPISARAGVIAAGFGNTLLKGNGIRPGGEWVVGAQAEAVAGTIDGVEIFTGRKYAPGYFAWMVPTGGNKAHIGVMSQKDVRRHFETFLDELSKNGKTRSVQRPLFRGITVSSPKRSFGERLLVAGDCAGQVKPITGGGLYFGLLCADIAVEHLTKGLQIDDLSARKLAAYEKEWKNLLGREIKTARYARKAYNLLGDFELETIFRLASRTRLMEKLSSSDDIGFDWHGTALRHALGLLNPFKLRE